MSTKKRSAGSEAGQTSKKQATKDTLPNDLRPPELRLDGRKDTLRFEPLEGRPMISIHVVQYYTQQFGQSLFHDLDERNSYIDVRFASPMEAQAVLDKSETYPFNVQWTTTINGSNIISPGRVKMYRTPRDRVKSDKRPIIPLPWNNPFPILFEDDGDGVKPICPKEAQPTPPCPETCQQQPKWPTPPSRRYFWSHYG